VYDAVVGCGWLLASVMMTLWVCMTFRRQAAKDGWANKGGSAMNTVIRTIVQTAAAVAFGLGAATAMAEAPRDCLLQGTVQKGGNSDPEAVSVKINSIAKYDQESKCQVRPGKKMEFKLPADPRVQDAPDGSTVKYRYRTESDGSTKTDLVSVGT